ncbi:MAG: sensor histidine kinase, partial [Candidatus Methylumidiphilus sp.]
SSLEDMVVDFAHSIDFKRLTEQRGSNHRLTLKTAAGLPETYYFRFFPTSDGTLALGGLDLQEQAWLHSEVMGLNRDLNNLTRSLHQANAELLELNQLKNQFLGMAAHDLRQPISVLMTCGEFVFDEFGETLPQVFKEYLERCLASTHRMKRLIDDFLDVSVIEAGKLRLDLMLASVDDIICDALPICRLMAEAKKVSLQVDFADNQRCLPVDVPKLQQVLINLVRNAVEHSVEGQTIWLSSQWDDQNLVFVIQDEGPGIAIGDQSWLFAAFERAGTRKTAKERSTGLGLAIAQKIVEAHYGRISVNSALGEGAAFSVALPYTILKEMLEANANEPCNP